jgi:hypothetical protein
VEGSRPFGVMSHLRRSEEIEKRVSRRQTYSKSQSSGGITSQEAKMKPKIVGFVGEGSRSKTFEHSQIFLSLGERRISGGGVMKTIRSTARGNLDH